jgi:hypothetical protein
MSRVMVSMVKPPPSSMLIGMARLWELMKEVTNVPL